MVYPLIRTQTLQPLRNHSCVAPKYIEIFTFFFLNAKFKVMSGYIPNNLILAIGYINKQFEFLFRFFNLFLGFLSFFFSLSFFTFFGFFSF